MWGSSRDNCFSAVQKSLYTFGGRKLYKTAKLQLKVPSYVVKKGDCPYAIDLAHLNTAKTENFMLCVFYYNFKKFF